MNRKMMGMTLKRYFARLSFAEDGLEGVAFMVAAMRDEEPPVSVIIMDSSMPNLDGIGATRQIRELGHTGLILGITGNVLNEQVAEFMDAGVDSVLPKPLIVQELLAQLESRFES